MVLPSLRWRGFGFLRRSRSRSMLPSTASAVSHACTMHGHLSQALARVEHLWSAASHGCMGNLMQGLKGQPRRQCLHDLRRWLAAAALLALLLALLLLKHVWQCQIPQVPPTPAGDSFFSYALDSAAWYYISLLMAIWFHFSRSFSMLSACAGRVHKSSRAGSRESPASLVQCQLSSCI